MLAEPSSTIELPTLVSATVAILALGRGSGTTILLAAKVSTKWASATAVVTGVFVMEPELLATKAVKTGLDRNAAGDTLKSMLVVATVLAASGILMPLPGMPSSSRLCRNTRRLSTVLLPISVVLARLIGVMVAAAGVGGKVTAPTEKVTASPAT